jgi:hypothetical protein
VLVDRTGLPETYTADIIKRLNGIETLLRRYEFLWSMNAPTSQSEELGDDGGPDD